ncbi:MAG: Gfo/Idh/MocA family oxidoreductase [Spirochaetales bacterium]|jgi:predicted dehydrogenase|nr:Gfo/Idh/MocA family oxidoreductase [Spirochaetales bacterium]
MSSEIRVGIIGAGANTRSRHIPGLQAIDGVEIAAVANRSIESGEKAAADFNIPQAMAHWKEIIASPDINAVVIGTWPYLHCPIAVAALEAGKHVLCEARMAMNAGEAREMYRVSLEHPELTAQIVPSPFTLGVDAALRRLIAEGYLGQILSISLRGQSTDFIDYDRVVHWREIREFSGNNILSLGIWYEAIMRWVGRSTKLIAMGKTFQPSIGKGSTYIITDIPDHLDVTAEMACGAHMHIQLSNVTGVGGTTDGMLFGSDGTIRFTGGRLYGARRGDSEFSEISIPSEEIGRWRVEEEFVGAIRGTESVTLTDFATGVAYMEFTDAVNQSLQQDCAVTLPSI